MEEQKNHLLPSNFVTIIQLKQRWLEKEQRRRELEKPEEQNRDQRQEIQPGELGEMSEEMRLIENLNLHALETDSQVRDRHQCRQSKHNQFAVVKNQGKAEASRGKEEPLVLDVKLDGPPDMGSENKANNLELAFKGKKRKNHKKKKKQTTAVVEKNPKSEGEPTQDQNCAVAMKHREHLPEVNGKKLRCRGRKTDKKKGIEDEYGPNSGNVNQIWEIGGKSKHFSINDETKTEDNRCMKHKNGIRQGYRDARVNVRLNRQEVQKEKGGAFVWVRKGEISSGVGYDFHSQVPGGSIDGPSGKAGKAKQVIL